MGTIWFWLVGIMLTAYVALDGFDIGVGILHLFITRSDDEKRTHPPHHRPRLGRQRGLAPRRRRNPLLRLPAASTPHLSAASICH